jgi:hypothetical protein
MYLAGLILCPIAKFSYNLRIIKEVFMARTHNKTMLQKSRKRDKKKQKELIDNVNDKKCFNEIAKHYTIKISLCEKIKLFLT